MFAFDSSNNVRDYEFRLQLEFAQNVIRNINMVQNGSRFGAISYGRHVNSILDLRDSGDKQNTKTQFDSAKRMKGRARVDEALKYLRTKSFRRSTFRNDATQIAIVIMGSPALRISRSKKEATRTRQSGITIIAIGVGDITSEEIRAVVGTSDGSLQYHLPSYRYLDGFIAELAMATCTGNTSPLLYYLKCSIFPTVSTI